MKEFASVCIYLDHIYITIVLYFISTSLILSISILSNAVGFSITIQFGHAALITLNISSADLTSDFNMSGHSIFFGIVDCPFRYIRSFFFFWSICLSLLLVFPLLILILSTSTSFLLFSFFVYLILLCKSSRSVMLILSISARLSLSHSFA